MKRTIQITGIVLAALVVFVLAPIPAARAQNAAGEFESDEPAQSTGQSDIKTNQFPATGKPVQNKAKTVVPFTYEPEFHARVDARILELQTNLMATIEERMAQTSLSNGGKNRENDAVKNLKKVDAVKVARMMAGQDQRQKAVDAGEMSLCVSALLGSGIDCSNTNIQWAIRHSAEILIDGIEMCMHDESGKDSMGQAEYCIDYASGCYLTPVESYLRLNGQLATVKKVDNKSHNGKKSGKVAAPPKDDQPTTADQKNDSEETELLKRASASCLKYILARVGHTELLDYSRLQYCVLGLRAASAMNMDIPYDVWLKLAERYLEDQTPAPIPKQKTLTITPFDFNGVEYYTLDKLTGKNRAAGWTYGMGPYHQLMSHPVSVVCSLSMTSAGVGAILILRHEIKTHDSLSPAMDKKMQDAIVSGLLYLEQFEKSGYFDNLYSAYGMERMGMIGKIFLIDSGDWYRLGAERLLQMDSVRLPGQVVSVCETAWELLFLKRATYWQTEDDDR